MPQNPFSVQYSYGHSGEQSTGCGDAPEIFDQSGDHPCDGGWAMAVWLNANAHGMRGQNCYPYW